ncbi:hypothetical protein LTR66_015355 [Elasticomyces elasticus]|nr:hypothetical protein LTR66_015355 [Elasticomyces elasticus]
MFKRRSSKSTRYAAPANYSRAPTDTSSGGYGSEKAAAATVAGVGAGAAGASAIAGLDFLPQQADDHEVSQKLSTVLDQIGLHVENFYADAPVPLNAALESELSRFETSQLPQPLAACFERAQHPTVLIKHCLAFHIVNLTLAPGKDVNPILPPELSGVVGGAYLRTLQQNATKEQISAFSTWKRLTAYLVPSLGTVGTNRAQPSSTLDISSRLASHFSTTFAPWRNEQYTDDHRTRHLTELIEHASQTAVFLFGQPDAYRFSWASPSRRGGESATGRSDERVVIVPTVSKATHAGQSLGVRGQEVVTSVTKRM